MLSVNLKILSFHLIL